MENMVHIGRWMSGVVQQFTKCQCGKKCGVSEIIPPMVTWENTRGGNRVDGSEEFHKGSLALLTTHSYEKKNR